MAIKPKIQTLTNSSVDILNAIRNQASNNYKDYVPLATKDAESIKEIGATIMDYPALQNEFLSALVNRIGRVLITSKMYSNPWSLFKKGMLEFGETVEEIFVNLAKPFQFDQQVAEQTVFKREIPDVRASFHVMNYQKYYKSTISNDQLRQAFLSWEGITDLISRIVDSMYTGANYDEFLTMKYLLARRLLNGQLYPVGASAVSKDTVHDLATTIKEVSNNLEFMSSTYNLAGVSTHSSKENQILIVSSKFDAIMDVQVLASAFNMDKAQFMGQRVLVDGFGKLDNERLKVLFADDPTYTEITTAQLEALDKIPCVLVDRDFFMIFDNYQNFTEQYNGEGLYWNYWYHTWKTFSVSPFANSLAFIPEAVGVTSVAVSPTAVDLPVGGSIGIKPTVVTTGFAPKTVNYSSDNENVTVDKAGNVKVLAGASGTANIKVTSVYDETKTATCVITIG